MSYIVTPSEKARAKTNPQPIGLHKKGEISSLQLFIKNLFGHPIPYLQFLIFFGLLSSSLIFEASTWLCITFGSLYIVIDSLSKNRELRYFFTGFEWLPILFFLYIYLSSGFKSSEIIPVIVYYRWVLIPLFLPYIFQLFPGINKYLYLLIYGGLIFVVFGLVQHFIGFHPFASSYPIAYSYDLIAAYPISSTLNRSVLYGIIYCFLSSLIWTRFFLEYKTEGKFNFWYASLGTLFLISCLLTYDIRIWILSILVILIPTFFISKKYFLLSLLSLLVIFYSAFWFFEPFRDLYVHLLHQFDLLKANMQILHANWFNSVSQHMWLGDRAVNIHILKDLSPEFIQQVAPMQNTYLLILKQVGILGFAIFFLFYLQAIFLNLRLLREVPLTHTWHRIFVISILTMQVMLHLSSLFFPVFSLGHVISFYMILVSLLIYFDNAYGRGIVPDDSCL